ncbi:hypothetical protein LEP1GSC188_1707 [Leptospira weilii serovar Topaz str. LT2116]|uniref:Uncharacterized protein n=1 Tax=Leptospira weilii serovar Topaz str. LT2116 TaxID=1088540 RepID=M3EMQ6_9LEPT|nr:hypothetical protein LEP1GSC188_1707 [Leptospira weilii serovar Topaz str. LT2116]
MRNTRVKFTIFIILSSKIFVFEKRPFLIRPLFLKKQISFSGFSHFLKARKKDFDFKKERSKKRNFFLNQRTCANSFP